MDFLILLFAYFYYFPITMKKIFFSVTIIVLALACASVIAQSQGGGGGESRPADPGSDHAGNGRAAISRAPASYCGGDRRACRPDDGGL